MKYSKKIVTMMLTSAIAAVAAFVSPVDVKAKAPESAKVYEGNRYQIYLEDVTWSEAKARCESMGGHLATITSAKEQAFVEKINKDDKSLWIGAYRTSNNEWAWVTGEKWKYTNWKDGEPNNSSNVVSNENSVAVWPKEWNDLNDKNKYEQDGFICEWEGLKPTKVTSVKTQKKNVIVKIKKVANAAAYEVQYSTSKKFAENKTKTIRTNSAKIKFKKAKKNKKYFVRVRVCYNGPEGEAYSDWSKAVKSK